MVDNLTQAADRVWVFPFDPDTHKVQPSVGVISTDQQTVLVDGGNSPEHAQRIQAALRGIGARPVSHIIYTHHHWDHVYGASVFDVPVVAHELTQKLLQEQAAKPLGPAYLEEQIRKDPKREVSYRAQLNLIKDWDNFQIVIPSITFSRKMTLPLEGITVELEHVGGEHAPDSIVVRVKEARVMFMGDCFYPGGKRTRVDYRMLNTLLSDSSMDLFIHGHSAPIKRSEVFKVWAVKLLSRFMG